MLLAKENNRANNGPFQLVSEFVWDGALAVVKFGYMGKDLSFTNIDLIKLKYLASEGTFRQTRNVGSFGNVFFH